MDDFPLGEYNFETAKINGDLHFCCSAKWLLAADETHRELKEKGMFEEREQNK